MSQFHFPTDTEEGRILGREVARRMLASPAMKEAISGIRAEVSSFLWREAAPAPGNPSLPVPVGP